MYWVGVLLRVISAISFILGIVICFFSIGIGIVTVVLGVILWNIGAKVLNVSANVNIPNNEKNIEVEIKSNEKPIVYQNIDYSAIPYDLSKEWESSDNKIQALSTISYMNQFLKEARKLGNIKERLEICTEEILWTGNEVSKLVKTPHTKTGKVPKYIVDFFFTTRDCMECEPQDHYLGHIYYMQDGGIGKAWVMCWIKKVGYRIDIGLVGASLIVKKIEKRTINGEMKVVYKWR